MLSRRFTVSLLMLLLPIVIVAQSSAPGPPLPVRWDELVASDWDKALELSKGTCILPIGILEKHGPHVPIGSDLIQAQYISLEAAKREYAVVFPEYFQGQIYEAKHAPGVVALPPHVIWDLLQSTLDEIGRNGLKKILIYNRHGGNPNWLRYFVQAELETRRDYVVYLLDPHPEKDAEFMAKLNKIRKSPLEGDEHAGEAETSILMAIRPDLVKLDRADTEDSSDQKRQEQLGDLWTPTSWYARFPHHYAGKGSAGTVEEGKLFNDHDIDERVKYISIVKEDQVTPKSQEENFDRQRK